MFKNLTFYKHGGEVLVKAILERDNFRCVKCKSDKDLTIDHIVPVKEGGANTLENQRILCRSCHSKRTNIKPTSQLSKQGLYQRKWRETHPGYQTKKQAEFRKRNKGYAMKYHGEEYSLYRNA